MTSLRQALMLGDGGVISLVGAGGKTSLMFKLAHELSRTGGSVLTTTTTKILEPEPDQSSCVIVSALGAFYGEILGLSEEDIDTLDEVGAFEWMQQFNLATPLVSQICMNLNTLLKTMITRFEVTGDKSSFRRMVNRWSTKAACAGYTRRSSAAQSGPEMR